MTDQGSDESPIWRRRQMILGKKSERMPLVDAGTEAKTDNRAASTLEMLQQASRHAQAAIETGVSTTRELQVQGEQLDRITRNLDDIESNLKVSDRTLQGYSRKGKIKNFFTIKPRQKTEPEDTTMGIVGGSSAPMGAQISVSPKEERKQKQREKAESTLSTEEDKIIDSLIYNVGLLRQQALLQGQLLDEQNHRLDAITTKTDAVHGHVVKTNQKIKKMS
ncbi:hypothetical protein LSM04_001418 [Trypanosoma melophagium]|uniref:uncharacterized protein n=1 Tax=Trypanosoma melophagium TaxID=715481 RepID=UPI00351A992F|nr:hypothetical protein LSM04_001418 [Trypanosoma melophagium]